jgi:hypothetical protein
MTRKGTLLQIYLALLLALTDAVASSPSVREAVASRHPRPVSDVISEIADSLATPAAATTD